METQDAGKGSNDPSQPPPYSATDSAPMDPSRPYSPPKEPPPPYSSIVNGNDSSPRTQLQQPQPTYGTQSSPGTDPIRQQPVGAPQRSRNDVAPTSDGCCYAGEGDDCCTICLCCCVVCCVCCED